MAELTREEFKKELDADWKLAKGFVADFIKKYSDKSLDRQRRLLSALANYSEEASNKIDNKIIKQAKARK